MTDLHRILKKQRETEDRLFEVMFQQQKLLEELINIENEKARAILRDNANFQDFLRKALEQIDKGIDNKNNNNLTFEKSA